MEHFAGAGAAAVATFRDLRRRPGILLASAAVAALLLLLPDICTRAVDESTELALQAGFSTVLLFLTVLAGFSGLRAGARDGDLGATPEWRASPLRPAAYVIGRFAGVTAIAAVLFVVLSTFVAAADPSALSSDPPDASVAAFAATGAILCAAQSAAVGMLLAAVTTPQLAAVLFVAALVASRTLVPELASHGGALAWIADFVPDPARLDLSRELAFHRPVDAGSAALACTASALQTAACLVAASWALGRRED
jgi:hypothetical protein